MTEQKNNDSKRIAALFENYSDYLFNYAITRVNDEHIAEDLVQDTFVAAIKSIKNFESKSKESTWLTAILKNKIIDHYRKKVNKYHQESIDTLYNTNDYFDERGSWRVDQRPTDWHLSSGHSIDRKEFYEILQKCIGRLNELQRIAFVMKHFDDEDTGDICKKLEITTSNYWVIIHRAKLQLRKCLELNWIDN